MPHAVMPHVRSAVVIDLAAYRAARQRRRPAGPLRRARFQWVPTIWGYLVPVAAAR